jgi:hypothetical protein
VEKRFGTRLAYLGGAIAVVSAVVAYLLDSGKRPERKKAASPDSLDDMAV